MNIASPTHYIAKKYARAFLQTYGKYLCYKRNQELNTIRSKLIDNRVLLFSLLQTYKKNNNSDKEITTALCSAFSIPDYFKTLIQALIQSHRLALLPHIFEWINYYYNKDNNHMDIIITSPQQLTEDEKKIVEEFINHRTQKILHSTYIIDSSLIAGLRIQGSTFLWEYSIAKFLRDIKTHAAYVR